MATAPTERYRVEALLRKHAASDALPFGLFSEIANEVGWRSRSATRHRYPRDVYRYERTVEAGMLVTS